MNSRKTAREALATLIDTIATFKTVYDRLPAKITTSPVATVTSLGTAPGFDSLSSYHRQQALVVAIWWKRIDDTIEDRVDDLSEDVFDLLEANSGQTASWDGLLIDEGFTALDMPIVDGEQYIVERIRVVIW